MTWLPDPAYFDKINTTNARSIVGIGLAVILVLVGVGAYIYTVTQAIPYCWGDPCTETIGQVRAAEFAATTYDTLCLFVGGLVGISVGGYIGKRTTDTAHKVAVEEAKKAPVLAVPPAPPVPPVSITARDQSTVQVDAEAPAAPAVPATPRPTGDARVDDERGEP